MEKFKSVEGGALSRGEKVRRFLKRGLGILTAVSTILSAQVLNSEEDATHQADLEFASRKGESSWNISTSIFKGDTPAEKIYNIAFPVAVGLEKENSLQGAHTVIIPHEYGGGGFDNVETTEEGDKVTEEMAKYIEAKLSEVFSAMLRVSSFKKILGSDFIDSITFKNFESSHPAEAARLLDYENLRPEKIIIKGFSSPEALIHGPKSLLPGVSDKENADLALLRAKNPTVTKALQGAGIQIDEDTIIEFEGEESNFTAEELEELVELAIDNCYLETNESTVVDKGTIEDLGTLMSIQEMINDYNKDLLESGDLGVALDRIVGSKRYISVTLQFETGVSDVFFTPLPITLLLLLASVSLLGGGANKKRVLPGSGGSKQDSSHVKEKAGTGLKGMFLNPHPEYDMDRRIFLEKFTDPEDPSVINGVPVGGKGFDLIYNAFINGAEVSAEVAKSLKLSGAKGKWDRGSMVQNLMKDELVFRIFSPKAKERGLDYIAFADDMLKRYANKVYEIASKDGVDEQFDIFQKMLAEKKPDYESVDKFDGIDLIYKNKGYSEASIEYGKIAEKMSKKIMDGYNKFLESNSSIKKHINDPWKKREADKIMKQIEEGGHGYDYLKESNTVERMAAIYGDLLDSIEDGYIYFARTEIERIIKKKLEDERSKYNNLVEEYKKSIDNKPLEALSFKNKLDHNKYTIGDLKSDLPELVNGVFQRMIRECSVPMLDLLPKIKEEYLREMTGELLKTWQGYDRSFDTEIEPSKLSSVEVEGVDPLDTKAGFDGGDSFKLRPANPDFARRHMLMTNTPIREDSLREAIPYYNDPRKVQYGALMVNDLLAPLVEESIKKAYENDMPISRALKIGLLQKSEDYREELGITS